jgi:hypothetical protein
MTTGESAKGRLMTRRDALPRKRPRTSASAMTTPKIVLSGTAMSAISSVSQKAWTRPGVVIDAHTAHAVLERAVEDQADRDEQEHAR